MAQVNKIDSGRTRLFYAMQNGLSGLPVTPDWIELEPNTYGAFGPNLTKVSRRPIGRRRARRKGATTDMGPATDFNHDLVHHLLQPLISAFMVAPLNEKGKHTAITGVVTGDDEYTAASGLDIFAAGDLVLAAGFGQSTNNGVKVVAAAAAAALEVTDTLANETPGAGASLTKVGHRCAAGDIDVTTAGDFATYTSSSFNFTTLNLSPGEWIFVNGLTAAANNGFKRVRSISANALVIDKSDSAMQTAAEETAVCDIYIGRSLYDQIDQTRSIPQLERQLGAPDDGEPNEIQSEYIVSCFANELTFNFSTAEKATVDMAWLGLDYETRDGPTGPKSGNRITNPSEEMVNTSTDITRIKMRPVSLTSESPTQMFAYAEDLTITVSNNYELDKALGVLGGFDATAGEFDVDAEITAYFGNVAVLEAIRANESASFDVTIVRNNEGIVFDMPLITIDSGDLEVEMDTSVKLPATLMANEATPVHPNYEHTFMLVFFDYLPDEAE